jgi:hypothetical protein
MSGPVPLERPEHCPGAYVMYFYCKYGNPAHPWQAHGGSYMEEADQCETRGEAIAQSRRLGWIYHRDGTATCPLCAAALRSMTAPNTARKGPEHGSNA